MKKLIVIVHGGNADYRLDDEIKTRPIAKNTYSIHMGNPSFGEVLDKYVDLNKFEVQAPLFPNATDANYTEWARFLDQIISQSVGNANDKFSGIILIGHSLGTVCLQRYLTENDIKTKFGLNLLQLHLLGCCSREGNFQTSSDWSKLIENTKQIFLYHSTDDSVCPYSEMEFYITHLPKAKRHIFTSQGHFEGPKVPELLENLDLA